MAMVYSCPPAPESSTTKLASSSVSATILQFEHPQQHKPEPPASNFIRRGRVGRRSTNPNTMHHKSDDIRRKASSLTNSQDAASSTSHTQRKRKLLAKPALDPEILAALAGIDDNDSTWGNGVGDGDSTPPTTSTTTTANASDDNDDDGDSEEDSALNNFFHAFKRSEDTLQQFSHDLEECDELLQINTEIATDIIQPAATNNKQPRSQGGAEGGDDDDELPHEILQLLEKQKELTKIQRECLKEEEEMDRTRRQRMKERVEAVHIENEARKEEESMLTDEMERAQQDTHILLTLEVAEANKEYERMLEQEQKRLQAIQQQQKEMEANRQLKRSIAATMLQSWVRGWKARKLFKRKKSERLRREEAQRREQAKVRERAQQVYAATVLQSHWRRVKAQRLFSQLKAEQDRQQRLQAAITLQAAYRGWRDRQAVVAKRKLIRDEKENNAALIIQTHVRRFLATRFVARLRFIKENEHRTQSAIKIQALYRAWQTRKKLQQARQFTAAVKLQSLVRCWLARKQYGTQLEKIKEDRLMIERQTRAANVIQAAWLACLRRKEAQRFHASQSAAATKIQSWWKGLTVRRRLLQIQNNARFEDGDDDLEFEEIDLSTLNFDDKMFDESLALDNFVPPVLQGDNAVPMNTWFQDEPVASHSPNSSSNRPTSSRASSARSSVFERVRPPSGSPPPARATRKAKKIEEDWGFKDPRTIQAMMKRSKRLGKNKKLKAKKSTRKSDESDHLSKLLEMQRENNPLKYAGIESMLSQTQTDKHQHHHSTERGQAHHEHQRTYQWTSEQDLLHVRNNASPSEGLLPPVNARVSSSTHKSSPLLLKTTTEVAKATITFPHIGTLATGQPKPPNLSNPQRAWPSPPTSANKSKSSSVRRHRR